LITTQPESLRAAPDAGANQMLPPMPSMKDIPTIPGELLARFWSGFYAEARSAVFKVLE